MIKHIVFDVDGTLLDTQKTLEMALCAALDQIMGPGNYPDNLSEIFGHTSEEGLEVINCPDIPGTIDLWVKKLVENGKTGDLYSGLQAVLDQLREEGFILGVVTNRRRQEFDLDFANSPLLDYFQTIVCVTDVTCPKPSPEPMLKYLELSGASREEVLFIGDSPADMGCAANSKVKGVVAGWGVLPNFEVVGDYYLEQPADIIDLVHKLNAER